MSRHADASPIPFRSQLILRDFYRLVLSCNTALASSVEASGGMDPGSPLYWVDRLAERIQLVFTFDSQAKAEMLSGMSEERLAEAKQVDDADVINDLLSDYRADREKARKIAGNNIDILMLLADSESGGLDGIEELFESASGKAADKAAKSLELAVDRLTMLSQKMERISARDTEKAGPKLDKVIEQATKRLVKLEVKIDKILSKYEDKDKDKEKDKSDTGDDQSDAKKKTAEDLAKHVGEATGKHLTVLEGVLEKAPERAKEAINKAIERSAGGNERAVEAIMRRGKKNKSDDGEEAVGNSGKSKRDKPKKSDLNDI